MLGAPAPGWPAGLGWAEKALRFLLHPLETGRCPKTMEGSAAVKRDRHFGHMVPLPYPPTPVSDALTKKVTLEALDAVSITSQWQSPSREHARSPPDTPPCTSEKKNPGSCPPVGGLWPSQSS